MDLIKTGLGLTQTIKNVSRFREIVSVLARNGFEEFIIKTGLHRAVPNFVLPKSRIRKALEEYKGEDLAQSLGYRLRKSFEELGPGFVKLGQLLATREDIFPPRFIGEMKRLQDQVSGIPFDEARNVIENSLKKPVDEVFADIDREPIGTASIGVAYIGRLKNKERVVIKVRRPGIIKTIETDVSLLTFIITQIERVSEEIRLLGISRIVQDFGVHIRSELDYRVEAQNAIRLKENIARIDREGVFYLPKIYQSHTTEEVLVMEYIEGIRFSDAERVSQVKDIIHAKLEYGIRVFVHTLLVDGFFHADLHGGNFFLLQDEKIGLIDFGFVGRLSRKGCANLVAILYSMVTQNYENLVYEFLDVAEYESIPDVDALIRDVRTCLTPFMGLTVQQISVSVLFRTVLSTLARHRLYLPRDWFVVFRALVTLDGVGKSLDMDFDIFSIVESDIKKIVKEFLSREQVIEEAIWLGRDVLASVRGLPRHLRWFLREFSRKNYALEVVERGYEKSYRKLAHSMFFLGTSFLSGVFGFSGVYLIRDLKIDSLAAIPAASWVFWMLALLLFGTGLFFTRR